MFSLTRFIFLFSYFYLHTKQLNSLNIYFFIKLSLISTCYTIFIIIVTIIVAPSHSQYYFIIALALSKSRWMNKKLNCLHIFQSKMIVWMNKHYECSLVYAIDNNFLSRIYEYNCFFNTKLLTRLLSDMSYGTFYYEMWLLQVVSVFFEVFCIDCFYFAKIHECQLEK